MTRSLSWTQFVLLLIAVLFLSVVYLKFLHPRLSRSNRSGGEVRYNLFLIDRVLLGLLAIFVSWAFISIAPGIHVWILLVLLLLFHDSVLNFIQGTILITELDLRLGQEVEFAEEKGILQAMRWTGIALAEGSRSAFLPYRLLSKNALKVTRSNVPQVVIFRCRAEEPQTRNIRLELENTLLAFPFLIEGSKPSLQMGEDHIEVSLALTNSKYIDSLIEVLDSIGITTEVVN